jgi:signal transduction histidine kinase
LLYAAQKKGQKALYYYDKYIAVKDSIFNTESMKHMQEMETRYQTREKEQQIKLLHLENSNQELLLQRTRLGNWLLAGFALLLLLSILPVYYFIKQKQNYRLLQERSMAENKECNRISRELHDGVVSNLSYLCRWGEDEQVDGHFIQKLRKVSDEIRGISHQLNVNAIGKLAFRESLIDSLDLEHFPKDIDLKIYLLDDFEVVKYDEKMNWIRIIKELLNNSLKYADASIIQIQFLQNGKSIHFQYQDNGKGVDLQKIKPGNGMQNIEDRVKLLGGKLEMKSEIGGGFECVITV